MNVRHMDPFTKPRSAAKGTVSVKRTQAVLPEEKRGEAWRMPDLKKFQKDDWILLGIIGTLILEGSRDYVLLVALGYLFIMGLKE